MRKVQIYSIIIALLLINISAFSQDKKLPETRDTNPKREGVFVPDVNVPFSDFKIIASTNTYIEIEFTPVYTGDGLNFVKGFSNTSKIGYPDVKYRSFPIYLPGPVNNRLEILDYKYEDVYNQDLQPVPTPIRSGDNLQLDFKFTRDPEGYSIRGFYPEQAGAMEAPSQVRSKYFTNVTISPVLYNPTTKTARKYSYIRFRVSFGSNPLQGNKPLSKEEILFFRDAALNSQVAMNWATNEFNSTFDNYPANSVLQSGDFYKIEITETGMYKLDKNFLQSAGIDVNNINPKTIKIFGNGGQEIPFNNAIDWPTDLIENQIVVVGEDDGVFNDADYVIFFGRSHNDWKYTGDTSAFTPHHHYMNPYTTKNYYWITYGGSNGLRMPTVNSLNQSAPSFSYFYDKQFDDPEINNLGSTGTLWFSQRIGPGESFNFNKTLTGYVTGQPFELYAIYGNGTVGSTVYFEFNESNSGLNSILSVGGVNADGFSHINLRTSSFLLTSGSQNFNMSISLPTNINPPNAVAYYEYIEIKYPRSLNSAQNNSLHIQSIDTTGVFEYNASTFSTSEVRVFDITDEFDIKLINPISYNSGVVKFQANHIEGDPREYFVVGGNNYKTPPSISSKIPNQNLHGITDGYSFIIISPKEFLQAAQRLKTLREQPGPSYLKTLVVDIDQIYNEFSGGILDPYAVRSFLKKAYYTWNERPVYVFFFGDGSYDYRNIYNLPTKNWLPPPQISSLTVNEIFSYQSDDFSTNITDSLQTVFAVRPDFLTGRVCANSLNEANTYIDKVAAYESPSKFGYWRKKIMYVADDGWTTSQPGTEGAIHTSQCEALAKFHTPEDFEKEKIYIVNYPTVITPQGRRKPGANDDIVNGWNEGRLVINYTGHGSADLWAHEQIFERQTSIPQLNNNFLPFVTIASCDLARYDDPFFPSAAEELTLLSNKGAIGVIAAVRPVFSTQNAAFNNEFWDNFTFLKDTLNLPIRLGRAVYNTKQNLANFGDNDAKFSLLCDPTVRIAIPQYFTRIDSINNTPGTDTAYLKALQKVKITGSVLRPDSTFWSDYNGNIAIKIFDVKKQLSVFDLGFFFNFELDGGLIFAGNADVTNGRWTLEFVVPKDISYRNGNGKLVGYFNNSTTDGSAYTDKFVMSGIDSNAAIDTTGPEISLFMGDRNFRSGDVVNQNTNIIADFFDENGLNLTGTIGHKIEAIINNNENNKIDLTSHYNATSGYQYGSLEYPLSNLASGDYNVKIKAWDTYNNYSIQSIDFKVVNNSALVLENVYNYPNPMADNTSFLFNHNLDSPIDVMIKIYTVSGRLIKELNQNNITDNFVKIDWDGRDDDGDFIANGTYIYKLLVKTQDGNFNESSVGKIAKLK